MKIKIDDRFHIDIDDRNYALVETYMGKDKNENPKERTMVHGYFVKLEYALERIMRINEAESKETLSMAKYIKEMIKLDYELTQALKEHAKVIRELEEEE